MIDDLPTFQSCAARLAHCPVIEFLTTWAASTLLRCKLDARLRGTHFTCASNKPPYSTSQLNAHLHLNVLQDF
jgi:hypothetical protein